MKFNSDSILIMTALKSRYEMNFFAAAVLLNTCDSNSRKSDLKVWLWQFDYLQSSVGDNSSNLVSAGSRERVSNSLTCLEFGPNSSILWASNNKGQILSVSVNMLVSRVVLGFEIISVIS